MLKSYHKLLWSGLILALVLRVGFAVWISLSVSEPFSMIDSAGYIGRAESLLLLGEYKDVPEDLAPPTALHPPGYPLFLLPFLAFGGFPFLAILVQCILSAIVCPILLRACLVNMFPTKSLLRDRLIVSFSLVFAFEPNLFYLSLMLMSETVTVTLILLLFYIFLLQIRRASIVGFLIAGLILACSAFVRPISYYFLPVLILFILFGRSYFGNWKKKVLYAFALSSFPLILFSLWQYRNLQVLNTSEFSTIASFNLLRFRAAGAMMFVEDIDFWTAHYKIEKKMLSATDPTQPINERRKQYVKNYFIDHPRAFALSAFREMPKLFLGTGSGQVWTLFGYEKEGSGEVVRSIKEDRWLFLKSNPLILFLLSHYFLLSFLIKVIVFLGIVLLFIHFKKCLIGIPGIWLNIVFVMYFCMLSIGPETNARFRAIFEGNLLMLACGGYLFHKEQNYKSNEALNRES